MQTTNNIRPIHLHWLIVCMACVVMMVFIGGVTRLSESGLSIVEWKLLSGTLPPLNEAAWQQEFAEYQTSPEFIKKNASFTVAEFKKIYWLEYIHRLMGRITGLVFLLPLLVFFIRQSAPKNLLKRMACITVLVGLQGTVGWVMVASGLVDQPRVSPIKLGLHLSLAFSVFGLLLYTYFGAANAHTFKQVSGGLYYGARALLAVFAVQLVLGAVVAGTDAGYSYNTYPLMDGKIIPDGLLLLSPAWLNILENITMVQFQHRMMALILINIALVFAWYILRHHHREGSAWAIWLIIIVLAQFMLGILTLLSVVSLPLASAHQVMALALLAVILRIIYASGKSVPRQH